MNDQTKSGEILEVRSKLYDLQKEREDLKEKKRLIEIQLNKTKNLVRTSGTMPMDKYKACCNAQAKYSAKMHLIEKRMGQVRLEIQKLSDEVHFHPEKQNQQNNDIKPDGMKKECITALVALREKYQRFSADHTRVSSMRLLASEFACELNPIIKAALKS